MYLSYPSSPFAQKSQYAADFVARVREMELSIKKRVGTGVWFLLSPFAAALVWLTFRILLNDIKKYYSNEVTLHDYKRVRMEYDRLSKIFTKPERVDLANLITQVPWIWRGSLNLVQKMFDIVQQRKDTIAQALDQLDASAPRTDLLQPVAEKDLWTSRTKVYDYRF